MSFSHGTGTRRAAANVDHRLSGRDRARRAPQKPSRQADRTRRRLPEVRAVDETQSASGAAHAPMSAVRRRDVRRTVVWKIRRRSPRRIRRIPNSQSRTRSGRVAITRRRRRAPTRCAARSPPRAAPGGTSRSTTCTSRSVRRTAASPATTPSPIACSSPATEMQIDLMEPLEVDSMVQDGRARAVSSRRRRVLRDAAVAADAPASARRSRVYYHGRPQIAKNPPWQGGFIVGQGQPRPPVGRDDRSGDGRVACGGRTRTRRPTSRTASASRSRCPTR